LNVQPGPSVMRQKRKYHSDMGFDWKAPGRDKAEVDGVVFRADVAQVKTMADGGYRVTLDIGEQDAKSVSELLPSVKRVVFTVAMTPYME